MALKRCILLSSALLFTMLLMSEAIPASRIIPQRLQKRSIRLCGSMLIDTLASVCQHQYYSPSAIKRQFEYKTDMFPNYDDSFPSGVIDPESALNIFNLKEMEKRNRGVADECCHNSCSYSQLVSYCGPKPTI